MKFSHKILTVLWIVIAFAVPAYANNPPQPDGLFSVLLVFPVVIFGARLAGVVPKPRRLFVRIISGLAVAIVSIFFLATGTFLGALAALAILAYAIVYANRIARQGHNSRRGLIAALVTGFALFAFVDYYVSIVSEHMDSSVYEYIAESKIRHLSDAEQEFAKSGRSASGESSFGTMKDLETARFIGSVPAAGQIIKGYRFGEILDTDKKHYVFYAIPAPELKPGKQNSEFVPGSSLIKSLFGPKNVEETGRYSFAVDETGQIRRTIRNSNGPFTREEVAQWERMP
jgi:hypothetical protein